jgi:hypothetical protein
MIKTCEAISVTSGSWHKSGQRCDQDARHEFNGRAVCWVHLQVLKASARQLRFFDGRPLREAGAR